MSKTSAHEVVIKPPDAIPLYCPRCGKRHVDEGVWATTQHHMHKCVDDIAGSGCGQLFKLIADDGLPLYYFGSSSGVGT